METDHQDGKGKDKESIPTKNESFDLSNFLNNPDIAGLLKHLLTGAGAMAGNYLLWIKPLQEKIEAMNEKIAEQERRIKELEAKKLPADSSNDLQKADQLKKQINDPSKIEVDRNTAYEHRKYRHVKF